jgi:hypothetical protein
MVVKGILWVYLYLSRYLLCFFLFEPCILGERFRSDFVHKITVSVVCFGTWKRRVWCIVE